MIAASDPLATWLGNSEQNPDGMAANPMPGITFTQRPDLSFVFINSAIEELTGVTAADFQSDSKWFWQVVHEADAEALKARLRSEQESPTGMTSKYRIRHRETGRITYLWERRRAIRTETGLVGFEGIWLDITRQTIAESRLLNMSWRENLGLLTMGLAHDFCNVMTGIVGLSETFQAMPELDCALRKGLGRIRDTAMQASNLAHRLRQLHQGRPGEKKYQDLNESVRSLTDLLQKVVPRRVRVDTDLASGQLPVHVDPVELQQVIINLAINAADAMPDGGEVMFRTRRHQEFPTTQNLKGVSPRPPIISLSVEDTGTGIPADFPSSFFDAFFTTKPVGKASGIGLYNARLFVEKHRAAISVETKQGKGSIFHLWFAEADFSEEQQTLPAQGPKRHTLLVAGPAGERLETVVRTLRESGFYAVPAAGEDVALEALYSPQYEFSAAIVLYTRTRTEELSLCQRIRAHKLPIKTVVSVECGNPDELAESLLQSVDETIPFGASPQDIVNRLKKALS
jgi:PAS domain S-box-containing protein